MPIKHQDDRLSTLSHPFWQVGDEVAAPLGEELLRHRALFGHFNVDASGVDPLAILLVGNVLQVPGARGAFVS